MIERQNINGRAATVAYLMDDFAPVADKDKATLIKVTFEDNGEMLWLTRHPLIHPGAAPSKRAHATKSS